MNVNHVEPAARRVFQPSRGVTASILAIAALLVLPSAGVSQQPFPLDPVVAEPVLEALDRTGPGIMARRSHLAAARSRSEAAGFAAPAVLSGELEDVPGGTDLADAGFRLEIGKEFLTEGRGAARRALALAEVAIAEAALDGAELGARSAAARLLALTSGWSAIAARLAAEDSLLMGAEGSLRARFVSADVGYADVLRLRTERVRVQTDRSQALAETRAATAELEGLLGTTWADVAPLVETAAATSAMRELPPLPRAPDVDSLVEASGDVRRALAEVERADAALGLVESEQRPRLAGAIGAQRVQSADGGFAIGPTLGFSLTLPFTARRANRAATVAASRTVEAARAQLAAARAGVRAHLTASRTRYEAAQERVAAFDTALLQGVRQEREAAVAAYRTGSLSLVELLDFERSLARVEIERRRAHMEAVVAFADLLSGATHASPEPLS